MYLRLIQSTKASGTVELIAEVIPYNGDEYQFLKEQFDFVISVDNPMTETEYTISTKQNFQPKLVDNIDYLNCNMQICRDIFDTKLSLVEVVKYDNTVDVIEKYYKIDC